MLRPLLALFVVMGLGEWDVPPKHDPEERVEVLNRQIRSDPLNAALYLERGDLHRQLRHFDSAVSDFERAVHLDEGLHSAHFLRAITLLASDRPAQAVAAVDEFLSKQPEHGVARLTRARALSRLGQCTEAATAYEDALAQLDPRRPQHHLERARAWARAGHVDRALAGLDEARLELGAIVSLVRFAAELELERGRPAAMFEHLSGQHDARLRSGPLPARTPPAPQAAPVPAAAALLIAEGAVWRYLDDGSDQGTAWTAPSFDDSSWASGPAQLGYGDGDEATVVSFGPNVENKFITTYFRHTFQVPNPAALQRVRLRLLRDDGAVVYLNGTEVVRDNMPVGPIGYTTPAVGMVNWIGENIRFPFSVSPALLQPGANVIAVEMHQQLGSSDDISFGLDLVASDGPPLVVRGPYLQSGSKHAAVVRWDTDIPAASAVWIGPAPGSLTLAGSAPGPTTRHEIRITGLAPGQQVFYAVGDGQNILAGDDSDHHFTTHPSRSTTEPTRVWVIGDSGTADLNARAVRDAHLERQGGDDTDVWLMLGDNAYAYGTEIQYQAAVFDTYPTLLRNTFVWPTFGNHDAVSATSETESGVYYDLFTLPRQAESGGLASGTEAYYSFDYADIHFICLNSHDIDRGVTAAMMTWLAADLAVSTETWTIAFWHHPPYTKGSHDSDNLEDSGGRMFDMRQVALPILEAAGVDLVLTGHSHSYERSFLLDGHHGTSNTLTPSMVLDAGNGNEASQGSYAKPTAGLGPHEGAVYAVAGNAGRVGWGPLNHPAMVYSRLSLGSMVLDIDGNRLDGIFLDDLGIVQDSFTILKGVRRTLTRTEPTISVTLGGQQNLQLDAGQTAAGLNYLIAGSLGTSPGFQLGSVQVPLNPDPYFALTLQLSNSAVYQQFAGVLDPAGQATATISFPPLNDPTLVGLELHHAYILFGASGWVSASNTVKLALEI